MCRASWPKFAQLTNKRRLVGLPFHYHHIPPSPMDHCGILYHSYDSASDTYTPAQLPLEEVRVRIWIVDGVKFCRAKTNTNY